MARHIPFLNSDEGLALYGKHLTDSDFVRIPLDRAARIVPRLPPRTKVWIDAGLDGLDDLPSRTTDWQKYIRAFPHASQIGDPAFHSSPTRPIVQTFVDSVLNACALHRPALITVPLLPFCDGTERNKVNRHLAEAAGKWRASHSGSVSMILPGIFTHQRQITSKVTRGLKIKEIEKCFTLSNADGFWIVDSDLKDDCGSGPIPKTRMPSVIHFHEELNSKVSTTLRIAGPYWGLNLLLWSKGLIDFPAIGLGTGFQYQLAGGHPSTPKPRLAIPSLRRRVETSPELKTWLHSVLQKIGPSHPAQAELNRLHTNFAGLVANFKSQIVEFYKSWFDLLDSVPSAGRSTALFQDTAQAYAFGKSLDHLPDKCRRPEAVAEHLMLNAL